MTIDEVMQWLESLGAPEGVGGWTMARLDASKQKRIGVWQRPQRDGMEIAIGRAPATRCKHVQLLVHWTENAHETELAAQALYDAIAAAERPSIGGVPADYIDLMTPEPVDVGADEHGIFERAIWLDIYHQQA